MTTSMSRRIDILCIPSRFGSGFLNSNAAHLAMCEELLTLLCVRIGILFTCRKHLHDRFISQEVVWAHKTGLTLPRFIEVTLPSQESKRSSICVFGSSICVFGSSICVFWSSICVFGSSICVFGSSICVFGVLILFTVSKIYRLECETVLTMWYFFIFHFILQII